MAVTYDPAAARPHTEATAEGTDGVALFNISI